MGFCQQIVRQSASDSALVIGCCVTLYEAFKAADELAKEGINIRVMDPFTIKPIDKEGIIANAKACGGKIVTVEDHYPEGKNVLLYINFFDVFRTELSQFYKKLPPRHYQLSSYSWEVVIPSFLL